MCQVYCSNCMNYKERGDFSEWYNNGCKPTRRCNKCEAGKRENNARFQGILQSKKIMNESVIAKLTPIQRNYHETEEAKKKLSARRKIEDLIEERRMLAEFDY